MQTRRLTYVLNTKKKCFKPNGVTSASLPVSREVRCSCRRDVDMWPFCGLNGRTSLLETAIERSCLRAERSAAPADTALKAVFFEEVSPRRTLEGLRRSGL